MDRPVKAAVVSAAAAVPTWATRVGEDAALLEPPTFTVAFGVLLTENHTVEATPMTTKVATSQPQ
jgi:hypothetical protein